MAISGNNIGFFFRAPVFPIVLSIRGRTWLAESAGDVGKIAARYEFKKDEICPVIDYRWEGWSFYANIHVISPLTVKKRYTKKEFLRFCGVSEKQIKNTDWDRYSKQIIFDYVVEYVKNDHGGSDFPKESEL